MSVLILEGRLARVLPTLLAALLAAFGPATLGAQAGRAPSVRGRALDARGAVRVWNLAGTVRVTGWGRDSVHVAARTPEGARLFFGGDARGVKVGVEGADDAAPAVLLDVRVPHGARVWVKTATAPVVVVGVSNEVELQSVSGDLQVRGRPAVLRAESLGGTVRVDDGAGWLRARASGGAVTVRGPVGDAELATVDGPVRLDGAVAERARLESVTGPVRWSGAVAPDATLVLDTNSGDVTLAAVGAATLDLLTVEGRIATTVPAVHGAVRPRGRGQAAVATLGRGASPGRVEVRSFRGRITVVAPASAAR